jgi:aldehyde:ferredoxin oxidoreductase
MVMANGYTGKILHVDLSNQNVEVEKPDEAFYRSYLGGRGIGYHYLMQQVPAGTDPFAPENTLALPEPPASQRPPGFSAPS